jgi:hypothetical protein
VSISCGVTPCRRARILLWSFKRGRGPCAAWDAAAREARRAAGFHAASESPFAAGGLPDSDSVLRSALTSSTPRWTHQRPSPGLWAEGDVLARSLGEGKCRFGSCWRWFACRPLSASRSRRLRRPRRQQRRPRRRRRLQLRRPPTAHPRRPPMPRLEPSAARTGGSICTSRSNATTLRTPSGAAPGRPPPPVPAPAPRRDEWSARRGCPCTWAHGIAARPAPVRHRTALGVPLALRRHLDEEPIPGKEADT